MSVVSDEHVVRVGYAGSYARGDWGVGSDLDIVLVLDVAKEPFERRAVRFDTNTIPVPCDLLVYTESEWSGMKAETPPRKIVTEAKWVQIR